MAAVKRTASLLPLMATTVAFAHLNIFLEFLGVARTRLGPAYGCALALPN
jgi:hypothetical protein